MPDIGDVEFNDAPDLFADFVYTKTTEALTDSATTVTVEDTSLFPDTDAVTAMPFFMTIESPLTYPHTFEIVQVTEVDTDTNTLTITRGRRGTTAVAHGNTTYMKSTISAQTLKNVAFGYFGSGLPTSDLSVYNYGDRFFDADTYTPYYLGKEGVYSTWKPYGNPVSESIVGSDSSSDESLYFIYDTVTSAAKSGDYVGDRRYIVSPLNDQPGIGIGGKDFRTDPFSNGELAITSVNNGFALVTTRYHLTISGLATGDFAAIQFNGWGEVAMTAVQATLDGTLHITASDGVTFIGGGAISVPTLTMSLHTAQSGITITEFWVEVSMVGGVPNTVDHTSRPSLDVITPTSGHIPLTWVDSDPDLVNFRVYVQDVTDAVSDVIPLSAATFDYDFTGTVACPLVSGHDYSFDVGTRNPFGVGFSDGQTVTAI